MTNFRITEKIPPAGSALDCASLPAFARSSLNRCNLPALILGSYTYQQHPIALSIDCVAELHRDFFCALKAIETSEERAHHFRQYMCSAFLLGKSEEAGLTPENHGLRRDKSDYLRLLRGWMFSADGIEAAVMKRWVESRFGLLTLNHKGILDDVSGAAYQAYQRDYVRGLYNSNALESQLDLLYSYCQYELHRRWPAKRHWQLYRGVNHLNAHNNITPLEGGHPLLLLNNLSSFSCDRDACDTFGDVIFTTRVPVTKLLYFPDLLPGVLRGEHEFIALGGVYQATILR